MNNREIMLIMIVIVACSGVAASGPDTLIQTSFPEDPAFSGNFVWDETTATSTIYNWDARVFSGFYYDKDSGRFSESMTLTGTDRDIGMNDLVYEAVPFENDFGYNGWGKYGTIGFLGQEYFTGYTDNTTIDGTVNTDLLSPGYLIPVLIDTGDRMTIYSGSSLILEEGYRLEIVSINDAEVAHVSLIKDGKEVDSQEISRHTDYIYSTDIGDVENVTIIAVRFDEIFKGLVSRAAFLEGVFQVSDDFLILEAGNGFGNMMITSVNSNGITMKNDDSIYLQQGGTVNIMGDIWFRIADNDTLRFAPFLDRRFPGTYENRGTVAENGTFEWTPLNFEGLYYDIDHNTGSERLAVTGLDGRVIIENGLEYTTTIQRKGFEGDFSDLDPAIHATTYPVLGFLGNIYVPVKDTTPDVLTGLLIDSNEEHVLTVGESLELDSNYTLRLKTADVEQKKAGIEVFKNEEAVYEQIIDVTENGGTLLYKGIIGNEDDIEIMRVHVAHVSQDQATSSITIDGIWLRDDENVLKINAGDTFGRLSVTETGPDHLSMTNSEPIDLIRGSVSDIAGDICFRVVDDANLIYYPYTETVVYPALSIRASNPSTMDPESYSGSMMTFSVETNQVADIRWILDGEELYRNTSVMRASYTNNDAEPGIHSLEVIAKNTNGEDRKTWNWTVNEPPFENVHFEPAGECSIPVGGSQEFYLDTGQTCTIEWYLDGELVQKDRNVTAANYTFDSMKDNSSAISNHYIKAIAFDQGETYQKQWYCKVVKRTLSSGHIWELRNGYSLMLSLVDKNGDMALLKLSRDGELIDQRLVPIEEHYIYNRSRNGTDQTIIKLSIEDMFRGKVDSLIVFSSIEQYPDTGTSDTHPVKLLGLVDEWDLGNGYTLKVADVADDDKNCLIVLDKDGIDADKRILGGNEVYIYQRMNLSTGSPETILELPVLNILNSDESSFVEFSNDHILNPDTNTVDSDPFLLMRSGDRWDLENGYSLTVEEVSQNSKALLALKKEGTIVDQYAVGRDSTYSYNRSDEITGSIRQILSVNSSGILDGEYGDYIEFYTDHQLNTDENTVPLEERYMVAAGGTFEPGEGYGLGLIATDQDGDKIFFNLSRDGQLLDECILKNGDSYRFIVSDGGEIRTPVSFDLDNVFSGEANRVAFISDILLDPVPVNDEPDIKHTLRDGVRIRGPTWNGTDLDEIAGPGNSDFIEVDASSFAGFFYDMDEGVSTETMRILGGNYSDGTTIRESGLVYTTGIFPLRYKSENLEGYYNIIGLFGEGYVPLTSFTPDKLVKLVADSDEEFVLRTGEPLDLPEGYTLEAKQIDTEGDKVWMELSKDGEFIEDEVIDLSNGNGQTWVYDKDLASEEDVVVMKVNFTGILHEGRAGLGVVTIEGLWLVDFENVLQLNASDRFGAMNLSEIGFDHLLFTNNEPIDLAYGSAGITDEMYFEVEDADNLRFHVIKEPDNTEPCEIRGTVAGEADIFEWGPENFEGFCYGLKGCGGTETLYAHISDRGIADGELIYRTVPVSAEFGHKEWGEYEVIGFMAEKYLAGYTGRSALNAGDTSLLSNGMLSRVLLDNDKRYVAHRGSSLILGEGYSLRIDDINMSSNTTTVSLIRDGLGTDTATVAADSDYVYRKDLGLLDNITVIAIRFNGIVDTGERNGVSIEGIFQISDDPVTINSGTTNARMEIVSYSGNGIDMRNDDAILLSRDTTINLTENLQFRVADSETVRFYPFIVVETIPLEFEMVEPADPAMAIAVSSSQVFDVTANRVCNFTWTVNGIKAQSDISSVSSAYSYTPAYGGIFNVTVLAEDASGTAWHTWYLDVTGSAPDSGSSSGSSGGGGGGASGERYENIEVKEVEQRSVISDSEILYQFKEGSNPIENIRFTALRNAGTITATVEVLKDRSSFAESEPSGMIYKQMNIWVGKAGFATADNIKDMTIGFRVERSWLEDNGITESSITMCRYHDDAWNPLPTKKIDEDDRYVYFESETPGFSPFAIIGYNETETVSLAENTSYQAIDLEQINTTVNAGENTEQSSNKERNLPGLSSRLAAIMIVFIVLLLKKRQ